MSDITTAFWGMTINNYDETDLALVRQGYPDFIRQIVYTLEQGEAGTPHVQAYLKLYRQQRLSYVKKLFPRGNFKALTNDEYKLNAQRYAQKLDVTAQGAATITNNPFPDPIVELTSIIEALHTEFYDTSGDIRNWSSNTFTSFCDTEERERVSKKPGLAKFYVSATYRTIKKEFWRAIATFVMEKSEHTHTHTHGDEKFSRRDGITNADDTGSHVEEPSESEEDGEDYEDSEGSEDEGYTESGSTCGGETDASSGSGE